MAEYDWQTVSVRNTDSGLWHIAHQNQDTGTLFTPEGCNLDDAERLEMYPALPDDVAGDLLCKRCYPTETDR